MSRLATALHAQPPGSWIDAEGAALQRLQVALDQRAQCLRALRCDPSPRLGAALLQLEREVDRCRRECRRMGLPA